MVGHFELLHTSCSRASLWVLALLSPRAVHHQSFVSTSTLSSWCRDGLARWDWRSLEQGFVVASRPGSTRGVDSYSRWGFVSSFSMRRSIGFLGFWSQSSWVSWDMVLEVILLASIDLVQTIQSLIWGSDKTFPYTVPIDDAVDCTINFSQWAL